jgi:hypothetical protein
MEGFGQRSFDSIRSKYGLLALDIIYMILIVLVGFQIGADFTILFVFVSVVPYMFVTKRKGMIKQFLISTILALIWILIANDQYGYNQTYLTLFNVNLFPLFAWACGLFGTFIIYSHYKHLFKNKGFPFKLLMYLIMYWPILVGMETLAYHLLDIRNVTTAQHEGLPFLDSMHAPLWMKISYFAMGPIFFSMSYILNLRLQDRKEIVDKNQK